MVSTRAASARAESVEPSAVSTPPSTVSKRAKASSSSATTVGAWEHTPTNWTLLWMGISLPLVIWDTGYVLGRPHTMPGGWAHYPLWAPYKLYGEVDYVYGWPAYNASNGFTGAQGLLNAVETLMYFWYLWIWYAHGTTTTTKGGETRKAIRGQVGAKATLIGFSAAVMTLSKTVLYWANEYYSGFDNIGHNPPLDLLFLWIIPNGAWLVGSAYMIWSIGGELIDGLELASRTKSE